MIKRTTLPLLKETVEAFNKMAFLSGPRQVGKTTLAQDYRNHFGQGIYFNWDNVINQKKLLKDPYFFQKENRDPKRPFLVVFDEIHKYSRWKNYLKGAYDDFKTEFRFLVTGSGRLELFKKGGDSLLGRYFSIPLFPLSLGELHEKRTTLKEFKEMLVDVPESTGSVRSKYDDLFQYSGFPEPFLRGTTSFYNRWFQERKSLLLREDIRSMVHIKDLSLLEMLSHLVPERVGSPLSINALKEDIGVAFETVRDWLLLLDRFFYLFRVTPYTGTLARSLRKETKVYLYDWVEIPETGYRFENVVALHLLKAVKTWEAMGEGKISLHYLRDKEKREVDFCLVKDKKILCLIECKTSEEDVSPSLSYFQKKLGVSVSIQLLHKQGVCKKIKTDGFIQWVVSADRWLAHLP
ncbi:MAG: ATP-binding protein [Elusimicrobiota bacterium]